MKKIGKTSQLAVKWANGTWTYYIVSKHRKFESLVKFFTHLSHFRFAILYLYNPKNKTRGNQIGYFSHTESWIN